MKIHLKIFDLVPARLNIGVMMFFACWINYMLRVNMSVNIIAMVPENRTTSVQSECKAIANTDDSLHNETFVVVTKEAPRQPEGVETLEWTTQEQAFVLSAYFWGYSVTSFLSALTAEIWGPRKVVFVTMIICGLLTILSPQAAKFNYMALVAVRLVIGLLAEAPSVLLSPGIISIVWCGAWLLLVYDSPELHPRISDQEKEYILKAIGDKVKQRSEDKKDLDIISFPCHGNTTLWK
ncbi:unnamed protein product [Leptidea sinapis]|uniref:Major facilitator superfamily (MFS) profile domain-containing protein n=1 Tax=Leptidea sinapis TaxID=189913 RepID=A0A5E4Q4E2_9NEOP|nr:unnamed protein product [Leptidea sinapis]